MTLDLHGVKHQEVRQIVEDFIFRDESVDIITGNSNAMKNLVINILNKHNINYFILTNNLGRIILDK
jgi:DNA-nicking Smr family endonuclease